LTIEKQHKNNKTYVRILEKKIWIAKGIVKRKILCENRKGSKATVAE
jgi:hypothetical protein